MVGNYFKEGALKKAFCFSIIVLFILVLGSAFSQTVDEIIAKNLQSKGGVEKLKAVKSIKMIGKAVAQGIEMPMVLYLKRPNLSRTEVDFQGQKIITIFDGEKAWMINPFMGSGEPMEVTGPQAESAKEQSEFDSPFIDYKEKGTKIELIGKEEVEGTPAYKLKVTTKEGKERFLYLDIDSCLEIKAESTVDFQGNPLMVSVVFSDYKEVDGLKFAFSMQTSGGPGGGAQIIFEAIEINPELDDSLFRVSK